MAKGILLKCVEDIEIVNLDINFYENILYTGVESEDRDIHVITRDHKSFKLDRDIFNRHFKMVING